LTKKDEAGNRVHDHCFYCGALVAQRGVGDHFPVPDRHGGKVTVPCCISCHDMKDRFVLGDWPIEWVFHGVVKDFPKLSRYTRIFLAKAMALAMDMDQKEGKKTRDFLPALGVTATTDIETTVSRLVEDRELIPDDISVAPEVLEPTR